MMVKRILLILLLCISQFFSPCFQEDEEFDAKAKNQFLNCLMDKRVRGELELTRDQETTISKLYAEKNRASVGVIKELLSPTDRSDRLNGIQSKTFDAIYKEVLLPHQRERSFQLVARRELQSVGGSLAVYLSKGLDKELQISSFQKKQMMDIHLKKQEKLHEAAKRFRMRVVEILGEEKQEVENILNSSQKEELEQLIGEKYKGPGLNGAAATVLSNFLKKEK